MYWYYVFVLLILQSNSGQPIIPADNQGPISRLSSGQPEKSLNLMLHNMCTFLRLELELPWFLMYEVIFVSC